MEIKDGTIHGKHVRFHCLRKFLIDRLSAYAGESQWKQIVGKAINEGAYVSQEQLRGIYQRAMKDTVINGNGDQDQETVELESALLDSQRRLTNIETTNEILRKELTRVNEKFDFLDKIINFTDAIETKEDFQKAVEFFQDMRWRVEQRRRAE